VNNDEAYPGNGGTVSTNIACEDEVYASIKAIPNNRLNQLLFVAINSPSILASKSTGAKYR
jgi:hypothetical protein